MVVLETCWHENKLPEILRVYFYVLKQWDAFYTFNENDSQCFRFKERYVSEWHTWNIEMMKSIFSIELISCLPTFWLVFNFHFDFGSWYIFRLFVFYRWRNSLSIYNLPLLTHRSSLVCQRDLVIPYQPWENKL